MHPTPTKSPVTPDAVSDSLVDRNHCATKCHTVVSAAIPERLEWGIPLRVDNPQHGVNPIPTSESVLQCNQRLRDR